MKTNIALWDRALRFVVGTLLFAWAVAGGPWWAFLGLALMATAAWRFCPIYAFLRTGTLRSR
jgi:hypothetical protein